MTTVSIGGFACTRSSINSLTDFLISQKVDRSQPFPWSHSLRGKKGFQEPYLHINRICGDKEKKKKNLKGLIVFRIHVWITHTGVTPSVSQSRSASPCPEVGWVKCGRRCLHCPSTVFSSLCLVLKESSYQLDCLPLLVTENSKRNHHGWHWNALPLNTRSSEIRPSDSCNSLGFILSVCWLHPPDGWESSELHIQTQGRQDGGVNSPGRFIWRGREPRPGAQILRILPRRLLNQTQVTA